jgi:hypothetical protein
VFFKVEITATTATALFLLNSIVSKNNMDLFNDLLPDCQLEVMKRLGTEDLISYENNMIKIILNNCYHLLNI